MVANVIRVKKPPWMEMGQWWRLWHRSGHRWREKCNMNVLIAIRERALSRAGHVARLDYKEICAKALMCRGLQWWRWRQRHWKEVEKDKWWYAPKTIQNLQVGGHGGDGGLQVYLRLRWLCGTRAPTCSRSWALETTCLRWKFGRSPVLW